ncbi:hypothetical protein LJR220_003374 [Bradyrhizobium sp. LjRoot220]|uniref:hypothetical protein n=1 Tax=Bradyrhizobium sp. LjRoot220 TaxID=3342284 RepID=UPI003ECFD688
MTEKKHKNRSGDIGDKDVPDQLSRMSLTERARLAALVEADGDDALRTHLLGAIGRAESGRGARGGKREVPDRWTQIHVLDRLEDAFRTLASQPGGGKARSSSVWPVMEQTRLTFKDLIDMQETGELEQRQADQNRVRLAPTSLQVSQMEQALAWPFQHLSDRPELARAIQLRALWASMGVDIRKRCERRGMDHDQFNASWQAALAVITGALIARKVPVS